jgi:hypoxanthine phosphoribosyltransferase
LVLDGFTILLAHAQIQRRILEMAEQLRGELAGRPLTFVGVLDGALFFMTDLLRALQLDVNVDFLRVSSYGSGMTSGDLKLMSELTWNVNGHDVVLVDDILDTGKTLAFCQGHLLALGAASVRSVVLLAKDRALSHPVDSPVIGFTIPDRFVIGYGMDWDGRYRHLPDIYIKGA